MAPKGELYSINQRAISADIREEAKEAAREYKWQEVAAHNTKESLWITYGDKVYDITKFLSRHPGGEELMLLAAGRDCTDLIKMYHPFSDKPEKILKKYEIGKVATFEHPQYPQDTGFYKEVCEVAKKYFQETGYDPRAPFSCLWRVVVISIVMFFSFFMSSTNLFGEYSLMAKCVFGAVFGVSNALVLMHAMHDSSHAALGSSEKLWFIGRFYLDYVTGSNMTSWHNQHVIGHHIYTNVFEVDPDLPVSIEGDPRRVVDRQKNGKMYEYQWLYLPPLYGILSLKNRVQDFVNFYTLTDGPMRVNPIGAAGWFEMLATKVVWLGYRIFLPLMFSNITATEFWLSFIVSELAMSYFLAFNFQVSHVSEACDYYNGSVKRTVIDDEWAISQVRSSVDYGHNSALTAFFTGALNYQTTHHLLPGISQYHYPALAPLIKEVCRKYGVEYNHLAGFREAWMGHINHLVTMGKRGEQAHLHMG